jgi:hypothetical protein
MIPVVVINLPHRSDRLEKILKVWPDARVVPGVIHDMPHTGCGLAHVSAIREGLKDSEMCLVLEDDAELIVPKSYVEYFISCLKIGNWDVISLGTQHDYSGDSPLKICSFQGRVQVEPTSRLISMQACVWNRDALPLLDEYEDALRKGAFFPIDRMIFSNSWCPEDQSTWEPCIDLALTKSLQKIMPPAISWQTPRSWTSRQMFEQRRNDISDQTKTFRVELEKENKILYDQLFNGLSTLEPRLYKPLNVVFHKNSSTILAQSSAS